MKSYREEKGSLLEEENSCSSRGGLAMVLVVAINGKKAWNRWRLLLFMLALFFLFYAMVFSSSLPSSCSTSYYPSSFRFLFFAFSSSRNHSLPLSRSIGPCSLSASRSLSRSVVHSYLSPSPSPSPSPSRSIVLSSLSPSSFLFPSPSPSPSTVLSSLSPSPSPSLSPALTAYNNAAVVGLKVPPPRPPREEYRGGVNSSTCKIVEGKWVKDESYPLYPPSSCPYIDESFSCHANGRPDSRYTAWRWLPDACGLPRFNGADLLERMRGKRVVFVGDSLNRNQYESMLCLLRRAVPKKDWDLIHETNGDRLTRGTGSSVFVFKSYNFSLEFYRSNFLVRESRTKRKGITRDTLKLDAMDRLHVKWTNADLIVFNTGHWWTHWKTDEGLDYFQEGNKVHTRMNVMEAFRKAVTTWATWVQTHVNFNSTQVFFRSYSPSHFSGGQWNSGGQCHNESLPIFNVSYLNPYPDKMVVVEEIIERKKIPVRILNVTRLSDFRKDAHPSVFGYKGQQLQGEDCSHWCLPGLPDIWNEILYAHIIAPGYYS